MGSCVPTDEQVFHKACFSVSSRMTANNLCAQTHQKYLRAALIAATTGKMPKRLVIKHVDFIGVRVGLSVSIRAQLGFKIRRRKA